jgi:hypothetical protein
MQQHRTCDHSCVAHQFSALHLALHLFMILQLGFILGLWYPSTKWARSAAGCYAGLLMHTDNALQPFS